MSVQSAKNPGRTAVVIGGGRWGRIVAAKLAQIGLHVLVATDFPSTDTDISRTHIAVLKPAPKLIYIASRSEDHVRDFALVERLGAAIWIEKNFSRLDDSLLARVRGGDNRIFSQQLFNTSIDDHAKSVREASNIDISTEVEKPIGTATEFFDWICHDLSLIARMLLIRDAVSPIKISATLHNASGLFEARYVIGDLVVRLTLGKAEVRRRRVLFADGLALVSGRDGVLRPARAGDIYAGTGTTGPDEDILAKSLKVAFETPTAITRSLTEIALDLHVATLPLIENLAVFG